MGAPGVDLIGTPPAPKRKFRLFLAPNWGVGGLIWGVDFGCCNEIKRHFRHFRHFRIWRLPQVTDLYKQNENKKHRKDYFRYNFFSGKNKIMRQKITYRNSYYPDHFNRHRLQN
jgi:hypothetical protein